MAQSQQTELALVKLTLEEHINRCEKRAARAEYWMRALLLGVLTLIGEAFVRIMWPH